jgi:SPP1 gp7 family putative phage head morphogenesis protein
MKNDKSFYAALSHSPVMLRRLMVDMARAAFNGKGELEAKKRFASALARTMALADVLGRKRALEESRTKSQQFRAIHADYDGIVVARFGVKDAMENPSNDAFEEAFFTLLDREPIIARSREEIEKAYGLGQKFAVAKLPEELSERAAKQVTIRLWEKVAELGIQGRSPADAKRVLADIGDFSESYAETIYRTNLAGAYTAGRFKQMQDPDVAAVAPALEYTAVGDHSTRKNHKAADGLIAGTKDAVWDRVSPPMGYNCRCDLRIVDKFELKDRGLLKAGEVRMYTPSTFKDAHPDKGFTVTRPDRRVYG